MREMDDSIAVPPIKADGVGTCTPPPGMTPEEAERLVEEAERERGNA